MTRIHKMLKFLIVRNGRSCLSCPAFKVCKAKDVANNYVWTDKDKIECYHEMRKWVKGEK